MANVVASIDSVLCDLEFPDNLSLTSPMLLKALPTYLRTFVLCVRKLSNYVSFKSDDNNGDGSVGSLLGRIQDAFCLYASQIHPVLLTYKEGYPYEIDDLNDQFLDEIDDLTNQFLNEIHSSLKDIDEWYINFVDYSQQSNSATADEVLEIMTSVLASLEDFKGTYQHSIKCVEPMKALAEKIKFDTNFIRFATLQFAEHERLKDLFMHIEVVLVNVAHLCHTCYVDYICHQSDPEITDMRLSVLLKKIKHVDPQVCETQIQVLTGSRLSREINAPSLEVNDDPIIIMKDFIDSLIYNLWAMPPLVTSHLMKDQLHTVYDGLRFFRTILKGQPDKFDVELRDLAGAIIRDSGLVILSLSQNDAKIDLRLVDLVQRIKAARTEFEEQVLEKSIFKFPRTNELGFLDFLLQNLELTGCKIDSKAWACVQTMREELVFFRSFLGEIVELRKEHQELQTLWSQVIEVAYNVEFLVDCLVVGDSMNSLSTSFDSIIKYIGNIKANALRILNGERPDINLRKVTRTNTSSHMPPQTHEVVGFMDEKTSIINRLKRGSKHLRIIVISGMPGLGKTTLATQVYNDPSIKSYFHVRAWCSVSQLFDKKKVLLEILAQVITKLPDDYFKMSEEDLADKLWCSLKEIRYLIFLDDVWDIVTFNSLHKSLPDDSEGSRIIITSRLVNVAPQDMLDEEPHLLRALTNGESWELLQKQLSTGKICPPEMYEIGEKLQKTLKGYL